MADYWISRDKYFCKYCKIYIADDKPSRTQHETGFRHKGNYERYIRDIYKRGARDQKDKNEEAKEIARIDAAAKAAMGIEGATAEDETPIASTSSSKPTPPTIAPKPSDPYANYTTAESLGYKDDEAEKKKEEAEMRQKEGTIGEWQKVVKKPRVQPQAPIVPTGGLLPVGRLPLQVKKEEEKPDVKEERGTKEEEKEVLAPKRKGYFTEKQVDTDDDFDPSRIGINLKRKRLTLKEEQALEEKAREVERVKEESSRRLDGGVGGWAQGEVKDEPMLEFEQPSEEVKAKEEDEKKVEVEKVEEKPATGGGGGGGFKKRKMHGAGTTRKK